MEREIIKNLIKWKNSKSRKPLILHGARQVGKTYILKYFGKEYYDNMIYVNFETNKEISEQINDNINAKYIINKLELFYGEKILPGKTLIFFDEIQVNERALTALKYFCEDASEYHIVAAGSLFGQPTMISMGSLTETYVSVQLAINNYNLYYWESNGIAKLDFLIQKDDTIIPIEVKSNIHNKSRSLDMYIQKYNSKYAIRISERNFGFENNIKSVPLYAVFCI